MKGVVLLFLLLLTHSLYAQSKLVGLGKYRIGITTPDSLSRLFKEQEQPVVKGTLALPCTHIRLFTADSVAGEGLTIAHLSLVFYDDRLFRIFCDYTEPLQKAFILKYGHGRPEPGSRVSLCTREKDKPMNIDRESWQDGDRVARVVRADGYNAHCKPEQVVRLMIADQRLMALTSECDLENSEPFFDKNWSYRP